MNLLKKGLFRETLLRVCLAASIGLLPVLATAQSVANDEAFGRGAHNFGSSEPDVWDVAGDGLFVRPVNLLLTGLGSVIFLATLPFSVVTGDVDKSAEKLVQEPAYDLFNRCFGCIRHGKTWDSRERMR